MPMGRLCRYDPSGRWAIALARSKAYIQKTLLLDQSNAMVQFLLLLEDVQEPMDASQSSAEQ